MWVRICKEYFTWVKCWWLVVVGESHWGFGREKSSFEVWIDLQLELFFNWQCCLSSPPALSCTCRPLVKTGGDWREKRVPLSVEVIYSRSFSSSGWAAFLCWGCFFLSCLLGWPVLGGPTELCLVSPGSPGEDSLPWPEKRFCSEVEVISSRRRRQQVWMREEWEGKKGKREMRRLLLILFVIKLQDIFKFKGMFYS